MMAQCLALVAASLVAAAAQPSIVAKGDDLYIVVAPGKAAKIAKGPESSRIATAAHLEAMRLRLTDQIEALASSVAKETEANEKATTAKLDTIEKAANALQFGNAIGPGDDLAATIKSLKASGGTIFLRRGDYKLNDTVVVAAAVSLVGEGGATILHAPASGKPALLLQGTKDAPLLRASVRGIKVVCDKAAKGAVGMELVQVHESKVEKVEFGGCATDIALKGSSRNWIQDNTMSVAGTAKYGGFVQDKEATGNVFRRNAK